MSTKDVVLLFLGGFVGAVVGGVYTSSTSALSRLRASWRLQRRQARGRRAVLMTRALQHYRSRGLESLLYVTQATAPGTTIPALYDPSLVVSPSVNADKEDLLIYDPTIDTQFTVNRRIIKSQLKQGARVFSGEILHVRDIRESSECGVEYVVGRCPYFAYATLCLRLQKDLLSRVTRRRLHDVHLKSLDVLRGGSAVPQAVGCVCIALFVADGGPFIAVANRSSHVLSSHDTRAAVPMFGMESNTIGARRSRFGLLYYNFLREFAEELFDLEALVDVLKSRRVDPDWILQLPPVAAVHAETVAGRLDLHCLGVSVTPTDGSLAVHLLAAFKSSEFFERLRSEIQANWESVEGREGRSPIEFVKLDDPVIDEWVAARQIDLASTVAIDLARVHTMGSSKLSA